MNVIHMVLFTSSSLLLAGGLLPAAAGTLGDLAFQDGNLKTTVAATSQGELRSYTLTSNAPLRDNLPAGGRIELGELLSAARVRSGNTLFDALYALADSEARENSVAQIQDGAYGSNQPLQINAFETGRLWHYVWTRDLAYATHLALAGFDTERAANSLLFKASALKPSVGGDASEQIIQDTGSGGSYPISTDRVVWILGASELLHYLPEARQSEFLKQVYGPLCGTLEQDRLLVFDPQDGLYRGEQSFLDWREQTYPLWTKDNVLAIGTSKALSVNVANYFALRTAADYAARLGHADEHARYSEWADDLKRAINAHFYDEAAGLYSTFLLDDSDHPVRVERFDALGESLAILLGVASNEQAQKIIARYPLGAYGPPVVWPQERSVLIYHNHALWPFVTAYWTKAARQASNAEAVNQGVNSLIRGAALNLSNMENLDMRTGLSWADHDGLKGPVINSQRQVWSVAGYLSMVQDVVFGLETSWDGIRFAPFVTGQMRDGVFAQSNTLELRNFNYRGKTIDVRVHLPRGGVEGGACRIERTELNGKPINSDFVSASSLANHSTWDIYLGAPTAARQNGSVRIVSDENAVFAPAQPQWENVGQGGLTLENGWVTLNFAPANAGNVTFTIYRDGQVCAQGIKSTIWTDPQSSDSPNTTHFYSVCAVDARTGNVSHLTPTRSYTLPGAESVLLAKDMENRGGNLVDAHHFENWGQMNHELRVKEFSVPRGGRFQMRAEFSNGAGPINSGITCAVKRVEVTEAQSGKVVAMGYFVMPQSGDWKRFDLSSIVRAHLEAGTRYSLRLYEDATSRNMSYLQKNERYTAADGGGTAPYNYVNIASVRFVRVGN